MRATKAIGLALGCAAVYRAVSRAKPYVSVDVSIIGPSSRLEVRGKLNSLASKSDAEAPPASDTTGLLGKSTLERLESDITSSGAVITFITAVVIMLCGVFAYIAAGAKVKQIFDYIAYVSPCIAAILAGLTAYFERHKGLLFAASITFLSLGVEMFTASKENEAIPVGIISLVTMLAVSGAITVLRLRAIDDAIERWRREHAAFASTIAGSIFALFCFYFITVYACAFFFHNLPCLSEDSNPACQKVWAWW